MTEVYHIGAQFTTFTFYFHRILDEWRGPVIVFPLRLQPDPHRCGAAFGGRFYEYLWDSSELMILKYTLPLYNKNAEMECGDPS